MLTRLKDRQDAGERLAERLDAWATPSTLVLGLPRGGVPVAAAVAERLGAPLDVLPVRKVGHPFHPELAVGALAYGGHLVRNEEIIGGMRLPESAFDEVAEREAAELERRAAAYRGGRPPLDLTGKDVVLVDDGLATGATMRAAVVAARDLGASRVVVAVPVAAPSALAQLREEADAVVSVLAPESFMSVGEWYERFPQTTDREVLALLANSG